MRKIEKNRRTKKNGVPRKCEEVVLRSFSEGGGRRVFSGAGTQKRMQGEESLRNEVEDDSKPEIRFWDVVRLTGVEPVTSRTATGRSIH